MKTNILIVGLVLLIIANLLLMSGMGSAYTEGFAASFADSSASTGKDYSPMGPFDGVVLKPENGISAWRSTSPNEPLRGPSVEVGPDNLFYFKNNQCKPSCCGASYSCDGGCVCTTPEQRQYLASRGGNRTMDDGI